eukprot:3690772-Pyramimonas_sp.AAC.1
MLPWGNRLGITTKSAGAPHPMSTPFEPSSQCTTGRQWQGGASSAPSHEVAAQSNAHPLQFVCGDTPGVRHNFFSPVGGCGLHLEGPHAR